MADVVPAIGRFRLLAEARAGIGLPEWQAQDAHSGGLVLLRQLPAAPVGAYRDLVVRLVALGGEHVVATYELLEHEGNAFLVREWTTGPPLADVLATGVRLRSDQAVAVVRDALVGLAQAHAAGLAHGGLAPSAVVIGVDGRARVADFGLPGVAPGPDARAFMSPEVTAGHPPGPAGDVYAAAALLVHLMRGGTPAPPSADGVDPAYAPLVTASLAPDPTQRPPSAAELLAALDRTADDRFGGGWQARAGLAVLAGGALGAGGLVGGLVAGAAGAAAPGAVAAGTGLAGAGGVAGASSAAGTSAAGAAAASAASSAASSGAAAAAAGAPGAAGAAGTATAATQSAAATQGAAGAAGASQSAAGAAGASQSAAGAAGASQSAAGAAGASQSAAGAGLSGTTASASGGLSAAVKVGIAASVVGVGAAATAAAFLLGGSPDPTTTTVELAATADIYVPGLTAEEVAALGLSQPGTPPEAVDLPDGAGTVRFPEVSGELAACSGCEPESVDGGNLVFPTTDLTALNGISGVKHAERSLFLVGVFLGKGEPERTDVVDLTDAGDATTQRPGVGEVFFVGDGRTDDGDVQDVQVPKGATRLYLGFADGFGFYGVPGAYDDNTGTVDLAVEIEVE